MLITFSRAGAGYYHLASMKIPLFLFLSLAMARADEPRITFEKPQRPESGIPQEATAQQKMDDADHGTLGKILGDTLESVTVRYFSGVWTDEKQVREYLAGLLSDDRTKAYTFEIWSQPVGVPEVECLLSFKNHQEGRLLLWNTCACVRDAAGKWWFVTTFDYFHRKHPKGDRSLVPKETKPGK